QSATKIFGIFCRRRGLFGKARFDECQPNISSGKIRGHIGRKRRDDFEIIVCDTAVLHELRYSLAIAGGQPQKEGIRSFPAQADEEVAHLFGHIPPVDRTAINDHKAFCYPKFVSSMRARMGVKFKQREVSATGDDGVCYVAIPQTVPVLYYIPDFLR